MIIFGADLSSSVHANNRKTNILVLEKGLTQGINDATIYVEGSVYPTNSTGQDKKVLSLHYNDDNSSLFVNGVQQVKLKERNSEISRNLLCLGNISTEFSISNMQKTGLYGNAYVISADYWSISTDKIHDIQRYLMKKKNNIV